MNELEIDKKSELKTKWENLKQENPKLRIRDAAAALDSTEAELLATGIGSSVKVLDGDFKELLKGIGSLGHVMALTRNDHVVHERKGVYEKVSFNNHVGLALGDDIDLRLFMSDWKYAFAVNENERKSIQFFNSFGTAIHKIYLTEKSNVEAYETLVEKYLAANQDLIFDIQEKEPQAQEPKDLPEVNTEEFQKGWLELQDTHDFFGWVRKHKLSRRQALQLAPDGYSIPISTNAAKDLLNKASEVQVPIMVFVPNNNCIQIHTGPVKKIFEMGPWINVMDPEFNLHLRMDAVAEAWVVKKPSEAGIVTSVELFDKNGFMFCQFFGKRKPGIPELPEWTALLESL